MLFSLRQLKPNKQKIKYVFSILKAGVKVVCSIYFTSN